jgi:putative nucleotidyltransferase with HDIG domain
MVIAVVTVGALALAVTTFGFPDAPGLPVQDIAFFVGLAVLTSAYPVRLPRGTMVNVAGASILAAAFLGGPAVAAWVAAVGSTEWREIDPRGRVPWYGTLFNHAEIVISAVGASVVYGLLTGRGGFSATPLTLVAALVSGLVYIMLNTALVAVSLRFRDGTSVRRILTADLALVLLGMFALVPLAWLVAHVYLSVGWWAATLFALPLLTTRGTYTKVVEIRDMFTQTVRALSAAVDAKDSYTAGHSESVQEIARAIGDKLRCSEAELEALEWGGLLHDIGKIGIPDDILLKSGKLTREERMVMNSHPVKGADIIRPVAKLAPELPIILHHHEWYNGSGYPDHLAGEDIPRLARILHVADAFEAMTASRPYRLTPLTVAQAVAEIDKFIGVQFDPVVVEAFKKTTFASQPRKAAPVPHEEPIPMLGEHAAMKARTALPRTASATN